MAQEVGGGQSGDCTEARESVEGSWEGARSGAVSTFTSEVEDSKEENRGQRRNKEEGLPCFRAQWAGRCGRKVGVDGRGVQSRASPTPPDFFR